MRSEFTTVVEMVSRQVDAEMALIQLRLVVPPHDLEAVGVALGRELIRTWEVAAALKAVRDAYIAGKIS